MTELEIELTKKLNECSLLLGIASGGIRAISWIEPNQPNHIRDAIEDLSTILDRKIQELFYE